MPGMPAPNGSRPRHSPFSRTFPCRTFPRRTSLSRTISYPAGLFRAGLNPASLRRTSLRYTDPRCRGLRCVSWCRWGLPFIRVARSRSVATRQAVLLSAARRPLRCRFTAPPSTVHLGPTDRRLHPLLDVWAVEVVVLCVRSCCAVWTPTSGRRIPLRQEANVRSKPSGHPAAPRRRGIVGRSCRERRQHL